MIAMLLYVMAFCLPLGGCTQKDLVFPGALCRVDVRFLWDRAPQASPEGMTLLFYPGEGGGEFWRFDIAGREGGMIEIPAGNYTMICVNNDLPGVMLAATPFSSASLSVREQPRSLTYASPSGMVYEGRVDGLEIDPGMVRYIDPGAGTVTSRESVVDCRPDSISTVYDLAVEEVTGLERVRSTEAVLEGCAAGVSLSSLMALTPSVAVPFTLDCDVASGRLTGSVTGFPSAPSSASYILTLRVAYPGGGIYEKSIDVTGQVLNSFSPHHVNLIIKELNLPDVSPGDGDQVGLNVDVDGWKVVEINYDSTDY